MSVQALNWCAHAYQPVWEAYVAATPGWLSGCGALILEVTAYRSLCTPAQVPSRGEGPAGLLGSKPVSASTTGSLTHRPTLQIQQPLASSSTRWAGPGALTINGALYLPSPTPVALLPSSQECHPPTPGSSKEVQLWKPPGRCWPTVPLPSRPGQTGPP